MVEVDNIFEVDKDMVDKDMVGEGKVIVRNIHYILSCNRANKAFVYVKNSYRLIKISLKRSTFFVRGKFP